MSKGTTMTRARWLALLALPTLSGCLAGEVADAGTDDGGIDAPALDCPRLGESECARMDRCTVVSAFDVTEEDGTEICWRVGGPAPRVFIRCVAAPWASNAEAAWFIDPSTGRCIYFPSSFDVPSDWTTRCEDALSRCPG